MILTARSSALNVDVLMEAITEDPGREVAIESLDFAHPWQMNLAP